MQQIQENIRDKLRAIDPAILRTCCSAIARCDPSNPGEVSLRSFCIPGPTYHSLDELDKHPSVVQRRSMLQDRVNILDARFSFAEVTYSSEIQSPASTGTSFVSIMQQFYSLEKALEFVGNMNTDAKRDAKFVKLNTQWSISQKEGDGAIMYSLFWVDIIKYYSQTPGQPHSYNTHFLPYRFV